MPAAPNTTDPNFISSGIGDTINPGQQANWGAGGGAAWSPAAVAARNQGLANANVATGQGFSNTASGAFGQYGGADQAALGAGAGGQRSAQDLLMQAANGQTPSVAAQQMQQGTQQALQAQLAAAASAKGGGMAQAAAQRQAANQGAALQQANVQNTGIERAGEMTAARNAAAQNANAIQNTNLGISGLDVNAGQAAGNLGIGYNQSGQGWEGQAQAPFNQQNAADIANQGQMTQASTAQAGENQKNTVGLVSGIASAIGGLF